MTAKRTTAARLDDLESLAVVQGTTIKSLKETVRAQAALIDALLHQVDANRDALIAARAWLGAMNVETQHKPHQAAFVAAIGRLDRFEPAAGTAVPTH